MKIYNPSNTIKNLSTGSKFICDAYGDLVYKGDSVIYNSSNQLKIGYVTDINVTKAFYVPDGNYVDAKCYITVEEKNTKEETTLRKPTSLIRK